MKHKNVAIFIPHMGCFHNCSFCNQRTISGQQSQPTVDEVYEILKKADQEITNKTNAEIAFFGGSFTAIDREYMLGLLQVANVFNFSGIRISTRPDCIDDEVLSLLKKYNVKAIELGAQSMDDYVLKKNLRGHTANDVVTASNLVKQHGFTLGLQMMVGLYGDDEKGAIKTCEKIIDIKPDTVRIYPTVVLKGTMLEQAYLNGKYNIMPLQQAVTLCATILNMFENNNINVIKLGLHASNEVETNMIAGIYHPAFRELCEGEIYASNALELLKKKGEKNAIIYVNQSGVSKLIGQKKCNLELFHKWGFDVEVKTDNMLNKYQLHIEKGG